MQFTEREQRAQRVFSSPPEGDPRELRQLAVALRDEDNNIEYARRVLDVARKLAPGEDPDLRYSILKDLAICTYKSADQPLDDRLTEALNIVQELISEVPDLARKQDLLGISGAIFKLRWESSGVREHLEMALSYYQQGAELGTLHDRGYNAINAAFVLEMLASLVVTPSVKKVFAADAARIRTQTCEALRDIPEDSLQPDEKFWFNATLGEAYLGLREFSEAKAWMTKAGANLPKPWQMESTVRQNARLASIIAAEMNIGPNQLTDSEPWSVIRALLGGDGNEAAAISFILGKVGLALSGGGFRASLFHIGVLARLAELDALRHVEVISCVSGGSIVGAFYYLHLRKKLQEKFDEQLSRSDYVEIVDQVQKQFLKGVQRNINLRMLMEFKSNFSVLKPPGASMTDRLARIYDRELYDLVEDEFKGKRRSVSDILIEPKRPNAGRRFNPKYDNWTRRNNVPILVLNATTLNTCHKWQFTGTFMGEPPARSTENNIDANDRLRRMYYRYAPIKYRQDARSTVKLSEAVAASACVPGLFDPLVFHELYGKKSDGSDVLPYDTRLVDGGAYDNQGTSSLLEQNCTVLLVSDASGQTGVSLDPGSGRIDVMKRTNNILMARVREAQYQHLAALRDSHALRGLMYIHLKEDLEGEPVNWLDSQDLAPLREKDELTRYGMRRDVQTLLAGIRTDLDSFSDCEADALMLSGYLMARCEFESCMKEFPVAPGYEHPWRFREIEPIAANQNETPGLQQLLRALEIARIIWGKPIRASGRLKGGAIVAALVVLCALSYLCVSAWDRPIQGEVGKIVVFSVTGILGLWGLRLVRMRWTRYRNPSVQVLVSLFMCLVGWILLPLYLNLIEPIYARFGPKYRSQ
jgi:predicted acylesterase/phospholipase RssA